jgi:serine/threonine protein kinase
MLYNFNSEEPVKVTLNNNGHLLRFATLSPDGSNVMICQDNPEKSWASFEFNGSKSNLTISEADLSYIEEANSMMQIFSQPTELPLAVIENTQQSGDCILQKHLHCILVKDPTDGDVIKFDKSWPRGHLFQVWSPNSDMPPLYYRESSEILGTPGYMAPEQLGEIRKLPFTQKTYKWEKVDTYAFGMLMYNVLFGTTDTNNAAKVIQTQKEKGTSGSIWESVGECWLANHNRTLPSVDVINDETLYVVSKIDEAVE